MNENYELWKERRGASRKNLGRSLRRLENRDAVKQSLGLRRV